MVGMPASLTGWVSSSSQERAHRPAVGRLYRTYLGAWYAVSSRFGPGQNALEREWDALVVLDGCRVDALRAVAPEYEFLDVGEIESVVSVGCSGREWLAKTFTTAYRDEVTRTAHVSANGSAGPVLERGDPGPGVTVPFGWPRDDVADAEAFAGFDRLRPRGCDDRLHSVRPGYTTECAIDVGRTVDADRVVVHYGQPGAPFVARAVSERRELTAVERDPWAALRSGDASREQVWDLYLDNLRYALDHVTVLLENLDARRLVITADHGEALGDWGVYGHRDGLLVPTVKRVPWTETAATDTGWRTPTIDREADAETDGPRTPTHGDTGTRDGEQSERRPSGTD